jgi:hypothetical protein
VTQNLRLQKPQLRERTLLKHFLMNHSRLFFAI